jgi:hypothetical protein
VDSLAPEYFRSSPGHEKNSLESGSKIIPDRPRSGFPSKERSSITDLIPTAKTGVLSVLPLLQSVFPNIGRCIVAKCGLFRARTGCQIANQRIKWPFPEIRVLLFAEKLSVGPRERAIGGQNGFCWPHPVTPPPDTSGSEKRMTGPVVNPVPGRYPRMGKQYYSGPVKGPVCQSG